jgi:cbb3-type cytochrome oxidase maturation protein
VSFLAVTIPVSLLLAASLLLLVIRAVRQGDFDDWEGPAARHHYDDDRTPEREGEIDVPAWEGDAPPEEERKAAAGRGIPLPRRGPR